MIIYYPTYYLVPVVPVVSFDEDEFSLRYDGEYEFSRNIAGNERYNTYRNMSEDIFEEIDEEYVNESTK